MRKSERKGWERGREGGKEKGQKGLTMKELVIGLLRIQLRRHVLVT